MVRYFKFFEYAYLIIAIFFVVESILNWNENRQKSYIYLAFSVVAVFMYFFRRNNRKKYENQKR